jgi:hypothetical protein
MTVLSLVARFAGQTMVDPADVYGPLDPFAAGVTLAQRGAAFQSMMFPRPDPQDRDYHLPPRSPYNNGLRAICFMCKGVNTQRAIAATATR